MKYLNSRGVTRLVWITIAFMLISTLTRVGLAIVSNENYTLLQWGRFMTVGLVFDLTVLPWFLLPWAVYDAVIPEFKTGHRLFKWEFRWGVIWASAYLSLFAVTAASEFTFWEEFGNRFDFIAVDYLIYTHEVIGNIRESYPINLWLTTLFAVSIGLTWFTWPRHSNLAPSRWTTRWSRAIGVCAIAGLGFVLIDQSLADTRNNARVKQLSSNGIYALFYAYRHNELNYDAYYPTLNADERNAEIRKLVRQSNSEFTSDQGIDRHISARLTRKDVNVVLVTMESLSADFMGTFGNNQGLTPELDKLAVKGLLFSNLYATGTRTVRGLEALTVGTPPTPGQSIVRRPNNEGLENLGEELKGLGWNPYWIYGGYGYFDNMNAYYKSNQYKVVDRSDIDSEGLTVHAENIWGIADEDLYTLAMLQMDREFAQGKRFFTQIMTTSNHRPYTFPENRVDMPQKKRESAVKYTDWAIGDFIRRASDKPWFDNTLFIFISDHTSKAAGKTDLPPWRYHIPMIWYAPKLIQPGEMPRLMSQIDVPPSLMGWLGLEYSSRFFGYDIFALEPGRERAFISTYQKLGYMKGNRLVVLDVNANPEVVKGLPSVPVSQTTLDDSALTKEAITWYQTASAYFKSGRLKDIPDDGQK